MKIKVGDSVILQHCRADLVGKRAIVRQFPNPAEQRFPRFIVYIPSVDKSARVRANQMAEEPATVPWAACVWQPAYLRGA